MSSARGGYGQQDGYGQLRAGISPTPEDDGYWESLLEEGEVASLDEPPPWIEEAVPPFGGPVAGDGATQGPGAEDWQRATELLEGKACCNLTSTGFNRGGLLVQFGQLIGFVPSSHLVDFPAFPDSLEREDALIGRVGKELVLRVIEIDRSRNRLVLSERAAQEGERCEQLFARLQPGDVIRGRVNNLRRFGAFVDLGGYEGLVHISEMSWGRVNHPGDVVQPGDQVEVYVLDINPDERKIQLSLKRLAPDPWRDVSGRYQVGQLVQGMVTNVVSFGAFVCLEEGIEGLIHISELAEGNFFHPRNVVREGEQVEARVLNVDPSRRRIGLSLRQASNEEVDELPTVLPARENAAPSQW